MKIKYRIKTEKIVDYWLKHNIIRSNPVKLSFIKQQFSLELHDFEGDPNYTITPIYEKDKTSPEHSAEN